jgi:hypothetical protein
VFTSEVEAVGFYALIKPLQHGRNHAIGRADPLSSLFQFRSSYAANFAGALWRVLSNNPFQFLETYRIGVYEITLNPTVGDQ